MPKLKVQNIRIDYVQEQEDHKTSKNMFQAPIVSVPVGETLRNVVIRLFWTYVAPMITDQVNMDVFMLWRQQTMLGKNIKQVYRKINTYLHRRTTIINILHYHGKTTERSG